MKKIILAVLAAAACLLTACIEGGTEVEVTSIVLDNNSLELAVGDEAVLMPTVMPSNATDKTVSWSSSDMSVAAVQDGLVRANGEGVAVITAKAGIASAQCTVVVSAKEVKVSSVSLSRSELEMVEGETFQLEATVKPDDAADKTVSWSSDDSAVVTVKDGLVTAVAPGVAIISAEAGGKRAECKVTVDEEYIPVSSVTVKPKKLTLDEGDTFELEATVAPDNATDPSVEWRSDDESVATVEDGLVTAVGAGVAIIYANAGGKEDTCVVTVNKQEPQVEVTSITLNKMSVTMYPEEVFQLVATVKPDNASYKTVEWSSANESIATVSDDGLVEAISYGSTVITARAGKKTATCNVNVVSNYVEVTSVTLDRTSASILPGESFTLHATVKPDNATDKTVTWDSSNPSAAFVNSEGTVVGQMSGTTVITAKAGSKSATCTVTVGSPNVPVSSITFNLPTLDMIKGDRVTIVTYMKPDNATDKTLVWSGSNTSVVSIEPVGTKCILKAVGSGTATLMVYPENRTDASVYDKCEITVRSVPSGTVDLGITMKNSDGTYYRLMVCDHCTGASSWKYEGLFFAWGERAHGGYYWWDNYMYCDYKSDSDFTITKYTSPGVVLSNYDDAVQAYNDDGSRMPSWEEVQALFNECSWIRYSGAKSETGLEHYQATGKNGNYIRLPLIGTMIRDVLNKDYTVYWSNTLSSYVTDASCLYFASDGPHIGRMTRCCGAQTVGVKSVPVSYKLY